MTRRALAALAALSVTLGGQGPVGLARAQVAPPLSSIDWLGGGGVPPAVGPQGAAQGQPGLTGSPPTGSPPNGGLSGAGAAVPAVPPPLLGPFGLDGLLTGGRPSASGLPITVIPLDRGAPLGLGLDDPGRLGLPDSFWGQSRPERLAALIGAFPAEALPAARDLFVSLLRARFGPGLPDPQDALLLARIDALVARGALAPAQTLIEQTGAVTPALFRRGLDLALLAGTEGRFCTLLDARPGLSSDLSARVFCLARNGDWPAALLSLEVGRALGQIAAAEADLLARFLDPDLADMLPPPPRPDPLTPLGFRLMEAIGAGLSTADLGLAYAHADLRSTAGWRARLIATERLVRAGALPARQLGRVMAEGRPAASGGVWDRVAALQALNEARDRTDALAMARALRRAEPLMRAAGLDLALADLHGAALALAQLPGAAGETALRLGLLSAEARLVALAVPPPATPRLAFLHALALGGPLAAPSDDPLAGAVAGALDPRTRVLPADLAALESAGRGGEALLIALTRLAGGTAGDPADLAGALAWVAHRLGPDQARRLALQLLILEAAA